MRRLLLIALLVWITSTITVFGSVSLARTQLSAEPFSKADITECEGRPCIQGIVAGTTSWHDVTTRFADSPHTKTNIEVTNNKFVQTTLTSDATGEKVFAINILFDPPYIPLSTLFARYGMPCKFRTYKSGSLEVIYPPLAVVVESSLLESGQLPKLSPDLKVQRMYFYST